MYCKRKITIQILSAFMVVLIFMSTFLNIPVFAENNIDLFKYDDYVIKYSIVNEWDNHQNIEIKITNTGNETIYNWALGYDADGKISGIWNGTIYENKGTNYIIKNAGYNYEILPGNSVTFGYTLQGENLATPDNFELCSKRIEINKGYITQLVIEDKWENGFSGYIEILNESDIPFEAWMLSFDANFVISDLWNAIIVENEDNTYKVSSQIMSNPISSGSSIKIGITASFETGVEPAITSELVSIVQIDEEILTNSTENIIDNSDDVVGKMYFKDLSNENDIICDSEGNRYFKNQILITACDGVSFDTINDLAHSMDAEIVGYIELTNDYQIEFNYDMSITEIYNIINELSTDSNIVLLSPNIVMTNIYNELPNDSLIKPDGTEGQFIIHNRNWNLHAIHAPEAWKYFLSTDYLTYITKIGVLDGSFYKEHNDLKFEKVWNNPSIPNHSHGTNVAGIIGAKFNNGIGIAGICPETELYGYAIEGYELGDTPRGWSHLMKFKYALALMIGNNVKVINISMAPNDNLDLASKSIEYMLNNLLCKNYDFVVVVSAGNGNDDAKNNSYFTYIDKSSRVGKHIIVVGACVTQSDVTSYASENEFTYKYANSKHGKDVDIVAPGSSITTTDIDGLDDYYYTFGATSAAAPQVAGVAGMMYSINPNLKGSQVKEMIISSAKESANTNPNRKIPYNGLDYYLLDAKAAVDMAMSLNGPFLPSIENNEAIVYGVVTDVNDEPVKNAKIKIKSITSPTTIISHFETDENGEYLITLKPDTYNMTFSINDESFLGWHYNKDYAYHTIKNKEITVDEEGYNNAYPLDVKLDNKTVESIDIFDDSNGVSISDVIATIEAESGSSQTVTLNSSELLYNDVEDGNYTISLNKEGYVPKTIQVNAMGGNVYDQNGEILEKIILTPIEASFYGTVTVKNLTTNEITPKSGHTVKILKDGEDFTSVTTQDDGTYRVPLNEYGDYSVVFDEEHQVNRSVEVNYDYEVNCEFEVEEEDDEDEEDEDPEDGGDDNSGNNGDGTEGGDTSDLWSEVIEDEFSISTEVDDPSQDASNDNVNVFGAHSVNLKDGLYVDCGEYTYRYYVADYELRTAEIWTAFHKNMLMYDIYKDGVLIDSRNVHCWYQRVVRSSNYKIWVHTRYVSSVGIKMQETNGVRKLYLTYTVNDIWNPQQGGPDTSREYKTYLATINDIGVTVRNY